MAWYTYGYSWGEIGFIASNPFDAWKSLELAAVADNEAARKFGKSGYNDISDAFRYCYFATLLSREFGYYEAMRI